MTAVRTISAARRKFSPNVHRRGRSFLCLRCRPGSYPYRCRWSSPLSARARRPPSSNIRWCGRSLQATSGEHGNRFSRAERVRRRRSGWRYRFKHDDRPGRLHGVPTAETSTRSRCHERCEATSPLSEMS